MGGPIAHRHVVPVSLAHRFGILAKLKISRTTLVAFSHQIEKNYGLNASSMNPYHNHVHAADVTQAVAHFMSTHQGPISSPAALMLTHCTLHPPPTTRCAQDCIAAERCGCIGSASGCHVP